MVKDLSFKKNQEQDWTKYYQQHALQYGLLVIVFLFLVILLFQVTNYVWKFGISFGLSLFYFIWGVWHHYEEKNLKRYHVLEYFLVSAIIFVVLYSIFL